MPNTEKLLPDSYFIGANTCAGFVGFADECFREAKRIYIIKGGPGTGKSTFMRKLAERAEKEGQKVHYGYCSSDSNSLDGVYFPEFETAVADGTSPHVMEPRYPGARESIVNFGELLDESLLVPRYDEIKSLSDRKSELYQTVYKYLGVLSGLRSERKTIASSFLRKEKTNAAIKRIFGKLGTGNGFELFSGQMTSLGMTGRTHLDSFRESSDTVYRICDRRGISHFIFDCILKYSKENSLCTCISRDPMLDTDAIYLPEKKVSFIGYPEDVCHENDRYINSERFIDHDKLGEERARLRFISGMEKELNSRIDGLFGEIGICHFGLEEIYRSAMDFDGKNLILKKLENKIFACRNS